VEEVNRARERKSKKKVTAKEIPEIYPVGSEVMVQVTKGPISNKGPRITTNISLAGRYLVLMPHNDQSGISRKIEDPKERERLRQILQKLEIPEGVGVIIRTIGEGQRARYFVRDLGLLLEQWRQIEESFRTKPAPTVLFQEPDLIDRTVRDFLTDEISTVYCDDEAAVSRMQNLVGQISKRSKKRIFHYTDSTPIFDKFGVQKQIDDAFHRQVWLKCGGYIVIDETEALIAIDVNTGRNKGGRDVEKTILQTNLEAADEVARQLRLRNIGGLIIGDFIDMKNRKDQQMVYNRMKERLKRDKAKTHVLPISPLGLMEMTRQRAQESLTGSMFVTCPYCHGRAVVKSPMTMSVEIQRALHTIMRQNPYVHDVRVIVNPEVLNRLKTEDEELLIEIERKYSGRLTFRTDPTYHLEKFLVLDGSNNQELRA
jgi:ribonuclease G